MDISHYYEEMGRGRPLILLHGNGEDCGYFSGQIEAFSAKYRVIAPDTRGHGRTPRGTAPFTIMQFAKDLADFMDLLGIEKAHVLGFSDGANIAMRFAMSWPERVDRLILDGGNLFPAGIKRSFQLPVEAAYRLCRAFAPISAGAGAKAELLGLMVNDPNIKPEELSAIKARTLVMAGTDDLVLKEHTELIASHIEGAELAFIEGGHCIARTAASEFNGRVLGFLEAE